MRKPSKDNPACLFCGSKNTISDGFRKNKHRIIKKYYCKDSNHYFTSQPMLQSHKTYPLKTILNSISSYNLGKPLRSQAVPKSTIHDWIKSISLPMNRLRSKLTHIPIHEIIIKHRFIHHQQPFLYQYHSLKLDFAKKFPGLISYLTSIHKSLPKHIFEESERISQAKKIIPNLNLTEKQNYAVKLAQLAESITKDNKQRHNIIENFMLINDSVTIATEIPIYYKNLTGHIDILQLRFHKLYILDYKPEPVNKKQAIAQLALYRRALSNLTKIRENKFKLAFFSSKAYYAVS